MKPRTIRIDAVPFRPALRPATPLLALGVMALALLLALLTGAGG